MNLGWNRSDNKFLYKMQGRQNLTNTERKGPHKSMHCKFCKPPGVITPEKPSGPLLETKTKVHLAHETADVRLCNTSNEPGLPIVENEACICVLEGENACPKCVPDKTWSPPKKKMCRCPKGAKPHPSMYLQTAPKQKKPKHEDNEFWWEKYSREHDLIAQETWKAYMAQRRKDKKLEKAQKRKKFASLMRSKTKAPDWYQKFSCQQMTYLEFLSTAIRLDSDENITDRTFFVLAGIGLFPRPKRKVLKKCLSYCHYNAIQFLTQLHLLIKDEDPLNENDDETPGVFTWNERLIMNCVCYLEFPAFLREIMDRLPPLPRAKILPQIPYPVFQPLPKKKYDSPYEEPIWQDRLNWVEKMKIDRLNRCRAHMETKRVKIPVLALVRRPSLIDARPPFLAQIEANERASRRLVKGKEKKPLRKHPITTFNSSVDVTAIAGIEASEISGTEKEDADELCVFLRGSDKEPEVEGEMEGGEEPDFQDKEVKLVESPRVVETQVDRMRTCNDFEEYTEEREDIPFKSPPKTVSGTTIASPCPPPYATPGPPAPHFEKAKRELDIINEEICGFFPYVSEKDEIVEEEMECTDEIEMKLKSAALKLKEFLSEPEGDQEEKTRNRLKTKKRRSKKRIKKKRKSIKSKKPIKPQIPKSPKSPKSSKESKNTKSKKSADEAPEPTEPPETQDTTKSPKTPEKPKQQKTLGKKTDRKTPETAKPPKTPPKIPTVNRKKSESKPTSDLDIYSITVNMGDDEEEDEMEEEEEATAMAPAPVPVPVPVPAPAPAPAPAAPAPAPAPAPAAAAAAEEAGDKEVKAPQPVKSKSRSQATIVSDPDPDSDDAWSSRPPCPVQPAEEEVEQVEVEIPKEKPKKGKKPKKLSQRGRMSKVKHKITRLREEKGEYLKKKPKKSLLGPNYSPKEKEEEKTERVEEKEKEKEKEPPRDVFRGDITRLVAAIVKDLAEEGFHCATFPAISGHPDIAQLIAHLRGEIINKNLRELLHQAAKLKWSVMPSVKRFSIPELGLSTRKVKNADWNDKKWIWRLAKQKMDQFYFKIASSRAELGMRLYKTLYQSYFGTDRFLNIFFAYMISKYEDAILRGTY